ncbi:hypothetical protein [Primorskyibacter sedentarius]
MLFGWADLAGPLAKGSADLVSDRAGVGGILFATVTDGSTDLFVTRDRRA